MTSWAYLGDQIELWESTIIKEAGIFKLVAHTPPKEHKMPSKQKAFKDNLKVCYGDMTASFEPQAVPNPQDTKGNPSYCSSCEVSKIELNIAKVEQKIEEAVEDSTAEKKLEREIDYLRNVQTMLFITDDEGGGCDAHRA
ncbi:hypothetical protein PVAP13_5NG045708 [Panicum virgatum]|uniref:Uncharacterized protein n=1 Tax=Panicum virgatum TaxID=38727 RepID=A0A8T0RLI3_PANVG|nr:hypothetical protein PVAP13_5NG045708 [Panicum virgatum]